MRRESGCCPWPRLRNEGLFDLYASTLGLEAFRGSFRLETRIRWQEMPPQMKVSFEHAVSDMRSVWMKSMSAA